MIGQPICELLGRPTYNRPHSETRSTPRQLHHVYRFSHFPLSTSCVSHSSPSPSSSSLFFLSSFFSHGIYLTSFILLPTHTHTHTQSPSPSRESNFPDLKPRTSHSSLRLNYQLFPLYTQPSSPMARLPFFRKGSGRPLPGRSKGTVLTHRLLRSFLYLVAWIFLVLVVIGNTSNRPVLRETYFIKIDLSNIIPVAVPNAQLINSIARSIGLHDFYQVGLWNFCEGYSDSGITHCSKPRTLYYFDPVTILLSELLAGASSTCPCSNLQHHAESLT